MMNRILFGVCLSLVSLLTSAQYKYTGPDGRVIYSDTPPPATVKGVQKKNLAPVAPATGSSLPYELGVAAKNFPVTIYTTPGCDGCDQGRSFLVKRGVPFSEKTITSNDELQALKKIANTGGLPVMTVGNNKLLGYEPSGWGSALDTAGYPATSALPPGYKAAAAAPLIAKKPEPVAAVPAATQTAAAGTDAPADPASPAGQTGAANTAAPTPAPGPAPAERPSWFKGF